MPDGQAIPGEADTSKWLSQASVLGCYKGGLLAAQGFLPMLFRNGGACLRRVYNP